MLLRSIRGLHSSRVLLQNPFLYALSASELSARISQNLQSQPSHQLTIDALTACRDYQRSLEQHDKLQKSPEYKTIEKSVSEILGKAEFSPGLLRETLLLKFAPPTAAKVILQYYERNPEAVIDFQTALIPFRDALWNGDVTCALKITDMTAGHPNYIAQKDKQMRKLLVRLGSTALGVTLFSKFGVDVFVEWGLLLPRWHFLGSVNAMAITYLLNLSFFLALVRLGRQRTAAGGDHVTWQKGTFYTHWYRHLDEMAMCSRILDADQKMNGGFENTPSLVEELCRPHEAQDGRSPKAGVNRHGQRIRLLEKKENIEDIKMQAYWMSGGDGFQWVEPDQDPAEILWRQNLHKLHHPGIGGSEQKSLKWAEELAN